MTVQIDRPSQLATLGNHEARIRYTELSHPLRTLKVVIDNGGTPLSAGIKGEAIVDFNAVLAGWTLVSDVVGSVVLDIWKAPFASYPPTLANTIVGATPPTLVATDHNASTDLTGWEVLVYDGDVFRFNIDSVSTVSRITIALALQTT